MHRTHTCGELRTSHVGQTVTLAGRVHKHRDLGGMTFIDLRDRYGITQITINPEKVSADIIQTVSLLRPEYCIQVRGEVIARPDSMKNTEMLTGEIELIAQDIQILTKAPDVLPFTITDDPKTSEEVRFKHRYLDLRRKKVADRIVFRSQMNQFARQRFTQRDFLEIQTPIFTVSSPEGARDYLIPSRVNPGQFYALPQSPQQYKQLLMVGGIDKYFQIAPCFRDEDPRADRHSCEFYQYDVEMSFVEQADIYGVVESFMQDLVQTMVPHKTISVKFQQLSHKDALDLYGSDKPDLRFGMSFVDMTQDFTNSGFSVFATTVANGGTIKSLRVDKALTRKEIDQLTDTAKQAGAKGLAYITFGPEGVGGPIAKFFSEQEIENIKTTHNVSQDTTILFVADTYTTVIKSLDKVRLALRDMFQLVSKDDLAFCWIQDFPFFEQDDEGNLDFAHNPFSYVKGGLQALQTQEPLALETTQYDLVLNGYEIMSGSIRNHDPEVLLAVFQKLGLGEDEIKSKFGAMYEAFRYGPPPHGGFAIGADRLMMILIDEDNIRECYAFPKSGRAQDVMMNAPSPVDPKHLEELGIALKIKQ